MRVMMLGNPICTAVSKGPCDAVGRERTLSELRVGCQANRGIETYCQGEREYLGARGTSATASGTNEGETGNGSRVGYPCQHEYSMADNGNATHDSLTMSGRIGRHTGLADSRKRVTRLLRVLHK